MYNSDFNFLSYKQIYCMDLYSTSDKPCMYVISTVFNFIDSFLLSLL